MGLLVAGGGTVYFGTLFALGLRVRDLKVQSVAQRASAGVRTSTGDGTGSGPA
jgi:hypothetical protein